MPLNRAPACQEGVSVCGSLPPFEVGRGIKKYLPQIQGAACHAIRMT